MLSESAVTPAITNGAIVLSVADIDEQRVANGVHLIDFEQLFLGHACGL